MSIQKMRGAIHGAAKALGLDDDTRRAVIGQVTKKTFGTEKTSTTRLTEPECQAVLDEFQRRGWTGPKKKFWKESDRPKARKVHAQWGELKRFGAIEAKERKALHAWIRRQFNLPANVTADPDMMAEDDLDRVIDALKAWIRRLKAEQAKGE
ncbi:phage protein GemA/Gp16 family protein [Rhodospirillum sp. A1_3_36]|uniref:phage protein GemA/Gp16 family protein n=1 Tax=Rhodospirillum sp. A1_3_36 TaxID=3391666 RepID=UPI0039A441A7